MVTNFDHESNIGAWRALEKRGIVVKEWCIERDGYEVDLDVLDQVMTERTKLVARDARLEIFSAPSIRLRKLPVGFMREARNRCRCGCFRTPPGRGCDGSGRGLLHLQLL